MGSLPAAMAMRSDASVGAVISRCASRWLLAASLPGVFVVASACARTTSRPAIPDTPAGRVFRVWLDAYNAADSAGLEAYARRYEPTMSVSNQLFFRRQTGGYDVGSVERSEPRHLEATLRMRGESFASYGVIDVSDDAAHQATIALSMLGRGTAASIPALAGTTRRAAIDGIVAMLLRNYVLPDSARRIADSLRARLARGVYDGVANEVGFAHRLTRDLQELGHDPHLVVDYAWQLPLRTQVPAPPIRGPSCGFDGPRVLDDSVALLKLHGFRDPELDCGRALSEAVSTVANARALVIDLRESTEGSRAMMAYLASYLVAGCTHLSDAWDRRYDRVEELWTRDDLPGARFGGEKPLVILTSHRTFAVAEELAYDLARLRRATVVGERTRGGAHVSLIEPVGAHLLARVPVQRVTTPITRTNWEGVGVEPDVEVPASEALVVAQRLIRAGRVPRPAATTSVPDRSSSVQQPEDASTQTTAAAGRPAHLRGIRFSFDTLAMHTTSREVLAGIAGVVEFAGGRGRLTVTAVRGGPAVSVNGIEVAAPLATPGDYYLFDNRGFILVRPSSRTFSSFVLARADFNQTGDLLAGAFAMKHPPERIDTLAGGPRAAQHGPISFVWHLDSLDAGGGIGRLYSRGMLDIADAPASEVAAARWFGLAAALANRPGGIDGLPRVNLGLRSVALLYRAGEREYRAMSGPMLEPLGLAAADVARERLVLSAGYRETRWSGAEPRSARPALSSIPTARWRTMPIARSHSAPEACRQSWLPEH